MATVSKTNVYDTSALEKRAATYEAEHSEFRHISHIRTPVILSTTNWLAKDKFISLWCNPLNTSWSLPRRETSTRTAAGVIRNAWRNRYRNTYYDEFTVNFTFQTGNVMPSVSVSERMLADPEQLYKAARSPAPPPGLIDFYRFIELCDQPMLLGQSENRHIILYRSRVFPRLRMEGYFVGETPIAFTESAEGNANMLQWTATFQCYKSFPPIWQASRLISDWTTWAYNNALTEMIPETELQSLMYRMDDEGKAAAKAKSKPAPTSGSATVGKPASSKELSATQEQPNKAQTNVGLVTGGIAGKGETALPETPLNPDDPKLQDYVNIIDGKLKITPK